ncbi:hypothetical protein HYZ97_02680 [Candidatus Pacearchaeota archaeon]|nr:hypothetical protein [Candidatus Pacearchaeota archaeon]
MNVKNLVLGVGIVIVFALLLWQGIEAFYPSPEWDDYCGDVYQPRTISTEKTSEFVAETEEQCLLNNGTWRNGYCDYYYECQQDFDAAQKEHSAVAFWISVIAGVIVLILGFFFLSVEPVGSALIGSGIWAFVFGTVINWQNFTDIWRFLLLLIAFVLLVWLTLRLNREIKIRKNGKKK